MSEITTKVCTTCKQEKDLNAFFLLKKRWYQRSCKQCNKLRTKQYVQNNKKCNQTNAVFITEKSCIKCKLLKSITEFHRYIGRKDGYQSKCKECKKQRHNELIKGYTKDLTVKQKKCRKCKLGKPILNFTTDNGKKDKYATICKTCQKELRDTHEFRQKSYLIRKKYRTKNKLKIYEAKKVYTKINWRLNAHQRIKTALYHAIRRILQTRRIHAYTHYLISSDIAQFRKYIESKFYGEMSWNNYGIYWEIDHIVPCSYFDLKILENQFICFNYLNLQPLTLYESRRKSYRILLTAPQIKQHIKNIKNVIKTYLGGNTYDIVYKLGRRRDKVEQIQFINNILILHKKGYSINEISSQTNLTPIYIQRIIKVIKLKQQNLQKCKNCKQIKSTNNFKKDYAIQTICNSCVTSR